MKKRPWLLIIVIVLVLIQFIRPKRNHSELVSNNDITRIYPISVEVQQIMIHSCNDCHSNNTHYPWYTNIQPIGWWLQDHINGGKHELNFSEFGSYAPKKQQHKLKETADQIRHGDMPLRSYLMIHTNSKLTAAQKKIMTDWADSLATQIAVKNNLPLREEQLKRKK